MSTHKERVSQVFDRAAKEYGHDLSAFFQEFGKGLVHHARIAPGMKGLDLATGTGAVLFPAAEAVGKTGHVTGIDLSPEMIREASETAKKSSVQNVTLKVMDAEELSFADQSFDFITCGFGLFFFPSVEKALAECKRVLKPDGIFAASTWGDPPKLSSLLMQEAVTLSQKPSLDAHPLFSKESLRAALENATFQEIQIAQEILPISYPSVEGWLGSLWSHGARTHFEDLSTPNLQKIETLAKNLAEKLGLNETLHVYYARCR